MKRLVIFLLLVLAAMPLVSVSAQAEESCDFLGLDSTIWVDMMEEGAECRQYRLRFLPQNDGNYLYQFSWRAADGGWVYGVDTFELSTRQQPLAVIANGPFVMLVLSGDANGASASFTFNMDAELISYGMINSNFTIDPDVAGCMLTATYWDDSGLMCLDVRGNLMMMPKS